MLQVISILELLDEKQEKKMPRNNFPATVLRQLKKKKAVGVKYDGNDLWKCEGCWPRTASPELQENKN